MKDIVLSIGVGAVCLSTAFSADVPDFHDREYDFPIYQNAPAGRQVSGQHAPASTPALTPAETLSKFNVPEGFEARLFAAEPMVVNPVTMTWDERGRLWVLELYEYPLGAEDGTQGRDRIKILEDTDADGVADKVHVWADDLSLATGLILGDGGAYVGQAPYLLHLRDTDGDDKADHRRTVLEGFGLEDRHELLNGFNWGPDGSLYMTHGVFTHSKVRLPGAPEDTGVTINAGVGRYDPRKNKFEVFADGTSNPWGVDFDATGNAFVSACVIDHLFHLAPGGVYVRQGGQPTFPYSYELLPSIVDHRHHMAAYCGVQVYLGDQYPDEYTGKIMMGNIHDNSVHSDLLTPNGSSFTSSKHEDFVKVDDGWFRPTTQLVGPDGAIWISDWYDKYPCYQNARADPAGVDREYGRVWRIVHVGDEAGKAVPSRPSVDMDLKKTSLVKVIEMLAHENIWQRKQAQQLLSERLSKIRIATPPSLIDMFRAGPSLNARLAGLWTLHGSGRLNEDLLDDASIDKETAIRMWAARLSGERQTKSEQALARVLSLCSDPEPTVRLAAATAVRQYTSGSLTVNTPPLHDDVPVGEALVALIASSYDQEDPLIPFMLWMAAEPYVQRDMEGTMNWFAQDGGAYMPLSGTLIGKIMRRVCDLRDEALLSEVIQGLGDISSTDRPLLAAALKGLIAGQRGKAIIPDSEAISLVSGWSTNSDMDVASLAQQLGTLWGDVASLKAMLVLINNAGAPQAERLSAIKAAGQQKTSDTRAAYMNLMASNAADPLKVETVRGLTVVGVDDTAKELLAQWETFSPAVRRAIAEMCTTRWQWKWPFFGAVESGAVKRGDVPPTVIRTLATSRSDTERAKAVELFGKVNKTSAEKQKMITEKRAIVLKGEPDLENGHKMAQTACFVCHKLHGEGSEIGPDLTGVGRSTLDALLANVIDPNQIIGLGYENVVVETKDGRSLSGRLVEENDATIKLINLGPTEYVISKDDIKTRTVSEMSLMPEGLEGLPDNDFRDMIWYILAPPQDGPLTDQKRQELIGDTHSAGVHQPIDGESVALWNPDWRVIAPEFEGTPKKHAQYAGRNNVLETHPYSDDKPSALESVADIPKGGATLTIEAASHERGTWEIRVFVQGEMLKRQTIDRESGIWRTVSVDLSKFAGRRVNIRVENAANDWSYEFGYWGSLKLEPINQLQAKR